MINRTVGVAADGDVFSTAADVLTLLI